MQIKLLLTLTAAILLLIPQTTFAQVPALGAAAPFALFTAAGAFNGDAATTIVGDIGTNMGAYTPPGFLNGQVHLADPVSAQAAADVDIAYGYLAGLTCGSVLTTPLGNSQTLGPNIYCIGTAAVLNADLILDGGGNPGAVFIFQINGALSTNSFSNVLLINGANLCNVYWQINGAFNVGGNTLFQGTVIADGAINLGNGATLSGRGLSTAGAISTSANLVSLSSSCNCILDITCPAAAGGTFQCISQIPQGIAADITVNSSCGAATVVITNNSTGSGCIASPYVLTRTYSVTDLQGHTASCTVTYTAVDNTAPTITCPAGVTVQCAGQVPVASTTSVVVGADNCGGAPTVAFVGDVVTAQSCANRFTLARTYQVADACGNTATCSQSITVLDNMAPTITCPALVTVQCTNQMPVNTASVTVGADNCGGTPTVTFSGDVVTNQTCANRSTITRTYQVADACGNTATCVQTIIVNDFTPPTISCPANVTVSCAGNVPVAAPGSVVTSDLCGGPVTVVSVGDVNANQTCANSFTSTRTYRVTDACGNAATCAQTITVNDLTPPGITCPGNVTLSCAGAVPAAAPGSVATSDLCGGPVAASFVGDVITNQTCTSRFTTTRTYRATDACGNTATCAQVIMVFDNNGPTFVNPPANVTVECLLTPPPVPTLTATDNCAGPVTVVFLGQVQTIGSCPALSVITRTWSATDACGNVSTFAQVVTLTDTTPPQFIQLPASAVLSCDPANTNGLQLWIDSHGGATAFDCSAVTWTSVAVALTSGCGGTFQRVMRFIATDACGNSSFREASFTGIDVTPPAFQLLPQNLEVACSPDDQGELQLSDWLEHFGNAEVSDACGSVATASLFLSETPHCGNTWSRIYQFRATDECGNTNFVTATFAVVDHTPPVIIQCPPGNLFLTCVKDIPGPDLAGVVSTDNCGMTKIMVTTTTNGTGCKYSPLVVAYWYMATDECGNMVSNCDQSFRVTDTIAPFYNGPDTIYVACAEDLPPPAEVMDQLMPLMLDNCSDFTCIGHLVPQNGPNAVTYSMTAKDFCGNLAAEFPVTFIANGTCKPFCTFSQTVWGNPQNIINGLSPTLVIDSLILKYGPLTAGKLAKTISVASAACLQLLLPSNGATVQFSFADYTANICQSPSKLLNIDGTLKNKLAANVLAMQLNIWYNLKFNARNLGLQQLAALSPCLLNATVLTKLAPGHSTVQGLLDLSNDYLAGVGFFTPDFGALLNNALENLSNYWQNCQFNPLFPCANSSRQQDAGGSSQTVTPTSNLGFVLYQNVPNPFVDKTVIGFRLPEAAPATLTVYDESGRVIFTQKGDFAKGYNSIGIERALLNTTGLLYYKLATATDMAMKKMIQSK